MPLKMEDSDIVPCVEVKIEIAHRASLRAKPTKEGFTHDWTVYVRGHEDCDISHFVEKVVFHLHHTFSNPRRVVKVPPYYVSEVGYAGFDLPIEIFFKCKTKPRKITFNYDLFMQVYEPVSSVRFEKLTFQKPTDEFKEKLINAGGVLLLPPGETQSADLCRPPTKTESPKKQKQPLTSKENVSKQMLNFSDNEKTSNSASLKSSVKQEGIDNNSKDHDAVSSRRSNSSSRMVSNPSPLPSQKRPSDYPIPSENKQKKARRSSSMSSERFRSEDKQQYEEKENKDKVKCKGSENKDESHSEYKDGKDCHKMDTSKQKSSKNNKEKKKESNLMKDEKKEAKDNKREVSDDKKELMNDKKEIKKDVKDDKKDVKDDYQVKNDTNEEKDGKRKVQNDKNESIKKTEVKNDKKEVKQDKMEINNDRKDVKDDRKGHKEVKEDNKEVKEVKDGKQDVIAKTSSKTSERRKQDDKCIFLSHQSKTSNQIYRKSALQKLMDELEDISSDDEDDITATVIFSQRKSSSTKSVSEKESSNISDTRKKTQNWIQPLTQSPNPITKSKEAKSTSTGNSIVDVKSQNKTAVKDLVVKTKSSTECEHSSSKPSSKGENDKENISNRIVQSETKKAKSEHISGSLVSAVDGSMAKTWYDNVKHLSKVTSVELMEDLFLSSDSSSESDDDFGGQSNGSDLDMDLDISPTASTCSTNKSLNPISSKSPLQILMDELKNILSDDGDISATKTVVKDLHMKQNPNEEKIKDTKEANIKENNFVTSNICSSEQAPNGEELIQLAELRKILMNITDLSVLQKAVKLILSTGYFEIDTYDSDLRVLNLNTIRYLQIFVATKL